MRERVNCVPEKASLTIEQVLALLTEAPPRLAALTENLTPAQLHAAPSPGEWSANDLLAHLRTCADVWGDYISLILTTNHPTIRAISPRTQLKQTNYPNLGFHPSLAAFTTQRTALLTLLKSLPLESWSRTATVKANGRILERTLHSYSDLLARHEQPHLDQLATTIAATRA